MSLLLEKILADVQQLDPAERLEVIARVVAGLQQQQLAQSPKPKLTRKDLFGCMRGQVMMAEDFNDPLSDFADYM
ncbi:DUF2281 domain-containing protein [Chamaesiphon sp. VAR_69_metabat_338]|uniref:DUF2281 domain-containing protein n=1 Tax=Chamaesiphon sp. VAR_69_metabat_338 TaxID=2964704 RepID=UPI00286D9A5D|nr:DUF2281 domain-containing protein [Chamaesiphon sp. VAR_69_metabat_338]